MDRARESSFDAHVQLADRTIEMLRIARELFLKQRRALVADVLAIGRDVHQREKHMTAGAAQAGGAELERIFVPMHIERVGDNIEAFANAVARQLDEGVVFTDRARREIDTLAGKAIELLEATRDVLRTGSPILTGYVLKEGPAFEAQAADFASFHQQRLIQGLCQPKASSIFLAIIDYLRGIELHERAIVRKISSEASQKPDPGVAARGLPV